MKLNEINEAKYAAQVPNTRDVYDLFRKLEVKITSTVETAYDQQMGQPYSLDGPIDAETYFLQRGPGRPSPRLSWCYGTITICRSMKGRK